MSIRTFIYTSTLLLAVASPTLRENNIIANTLKSRKERRAKVTSVRYQITSKVTAHKRTSPLTGRLVVPNDVIYAERLTFFFDLQNGWFRRDRDGNEFDTTNQCVVPCKASEVFYNGICRAMRIPVDGLTDAAPKSGRFADFTIVSGDLSEQIFDAEQLPMFYNIGVAPTLVNDKLYLGQFHRYDPQINEGAISLSTGSSVANTPI